MYSKEYSEILELLRKWRICFIIPGRSFDFMLLNLKILQYMPLYNQLIVKPILLYFYDIHYILERLK